MMHLKAQRFPLPLLRHRMHKEFTDYVQPNNVVDSGEIDANYFQHQPYLDDFNAENNTHVVSVATIHVEPIAIYGGKQTSLDVIKK